MFEARGDFKKEVKMGIDTAHLVGSFGKDNFAAFMSIMETHGLSCDEPLSGNANHGYEECVIHKDKLWWLYRGREDSADSFLFQLKGQACSILGLEGVYDFLWDTMSTVLGTQATRLDPCADFYGFSGKHLFDCMEFAVDSGDCWRGNKRVTKCRPIPDKDLGRIVGRTLYIGGQNSQIRRRVYDKGQQMGEKDLQPGQKVRVEDEFHKARAHKMLMELLNHGREKSSVDQLRSMLVGAICGSFEFRRKIKKGEWEDLDWFADLKTFMDCQSLVQVPADHKVRDFETWLSFNRGDCSHLRVLEDLAAAYNELNGTDLHWGEVGFRVLGRIPLGSGHKIRREIIGPALDILSDYEDDADL